MKTPTVAPSSPSIGDITTSIPQPVVDQSTMELIALAMSALISDGDIYPAEWEDRNDPLPDITVGSGNNYWLRRMNNPSSDYDLYLQFRYSDWLKNGWDELSRYAPSRSWVAIRMLVLCKQIRDRIGIRIQLPFTYEDAKAVMPKPFSSAPKS